jgi:hypothetical protein
MNEMGTQQPGRIQRRPLPVTPETIMSQAPSSPVQSQGGQQAPSTGKKFTLRDYMVTRGNGSIPRSMKNGGGIQQPVQGFKSGGTNKGAGSSPKKQTVASYKCGGTNPKK